MQNEVITKTATETKGVEVSQQEQLISNDGRSKITETSAAELEKEVTEELVSFPIESVRVEAKNILREMNWRQMYGLISMH